MKTDQLMGWLVFFVLEETDWGLKSTNDRNINAPAPAPIPINLKANQPKSRNVSQNIYAFTVMDKHKHVLK
ncbi:hypothetical protein [Oceanobacillus halophilus]|uniref:Uncharacterized protein n=1 Tax=Oceanobacillus halophilus TaxID=930130 RepID=A0A495A009_9BACI|nr:hypothetical protein [Oceanobacillus halophilus]RKQ32622.1 hypothetical protein D8M06_11830 [Oceanobacillus halophilus]